MKTITEFSGFTLKEAISKKAALLTEGKTEEEAQAAINEQLKLLDETKVSFYTNAVDMSKSRIDQVKRVVVAIKSTETEVVPEAFSERGGNFYLVEFFPQAGAMSRGRNDDRDDRFGRGDSRGRGGSDRGRGGNDRGRGGRGGGGDRPQGERNFSDRAPRAPREDRPAPSGAPSPFVVNPADPNFKPKAPAPRGERKPRPPRGEGRGPRPEGAARAPREQQGPKGAAELRLVLKGQSQSTLQGSGPVIPVTPAAEVTTSSDTQQG